MALYTAAYGGMAGCLFFLITLWAKRIAGDNGCALSVSQLVIRQALAPAWREHKDSLGHDPQHPEPGVG